MRRVVCKDCGKRYDFDIDDFCPKCGSFNPPRKTWDVDAKGNVIRVDGINERNHAGSFVHQEVHSEKAKRRAAGLDRRSRGFSGKSFSRAMNQTLDASAKVIKFLLKY